MKEKLKVKAKFFVLYFAIENKKSTRNDIQLSKIKFKKFEKINLNYLVT